MRKLTADYIFTGKTAPIKQGTIIIDSNGLIQSISTKRAKDAEYFQGIICPGFVNVHTHLELSYAKDAIEPGRGIDVFIHELEQLKQRIPQAEKSKAIVSAIREMQLSGTVAAGDIMNTDQSLEAKQNSTMQFYNFIEVYGSQAKDALRIWDRMFSLSLAVPEPKNIVPHAPYSLSRTLFQKIRDYQKPAHTLSMHHMESEGEADFFLDASGALAARFRSWGLDLPAHVPTGKRPLASLSDFLQTTDKLLLIHNTFITKDDIELANKMSPSVFYGLCPNANLFIENHLPPVNLLKEATSNICIGTDSLASNRQLNVLEELKTLDKNFDIDLQELIQWATLNGARALGMQNKLGSIETGKSPGLVHIKNVDFESKQPLRNAVSELIVF